MREKGLCSECMRSKPRCYLKVAEEIALNPKKTPQDKQIELTKNYEAAKIDLCSNVNDDRMHPNFKGKKLL